MKIRMKNVLWTVVGIIAAIVIIGGAICLIDGRSPQAIIVAHSFPKLTMEDYEQVKGEKTDKSTVEIPEEVEFPREMRQYRVGGMQVFHMEPQDASKPIVLYIHGGAYTEEILPFFSISMIYCYTARDTHPLMLQLYQQLVKQYSAGRIIVMGDSAGGGFSLALAQEMRGDSIEQPKHLVLVSPWVDVLGGDDTIQEHDTFLNAEVLRKVGTDWAGEIDPHDPMISPLNGDMVGLPPTDLFTGTWEIFYTDVVNTFDKMKAAGVDAQLHVAEKMGHVYPLWPCPEGKKARKEIAEIILQ